MAITLDEAKELFNQGRLPYRCLIGYHCAWRLDFIVWRLGALDGKCAVCAQVLASADAEVDHQHSMNRRRDGGTGRVWQGEEGQRGYVRDIVHSGCNHAVDTVERGLILQRGGLDAVRWYLIAYAREDEPRRRSRSVVRAAPPANSRYR